MEGIYRKMMDDDNISVRWDDRVEWTDTVEQKDDMLKRTLRKSCDVFENGKSENIWRTLSEPGRI